VLREHKRYRDHDLALYVDGFSPPRWARTTNRSIGSTRSSRGFRRAVRSGRAHGARRERVPERRAELQYGLSPRIRRGPEVQEHGLLRHRALQERVVPLAARPNRRSGATVPRRLQNRRKPDRT
jgi:hypothetical protein